MVARNGLRDWLLQRISAVVLLLYLAFLAGVLLLNPELDYAAWREIFSRAWVRIFSLASALSLCLHAWIGMWTISTDYLTKAMLGGAALAVRLAFQLFCLAVLFVYLIWALRILWNI